MFPELAPPAGGDDADVAALRAELSREPATRNTSIIAALLLLVFVVAGLGDSSPATVALLVAVLLFHEGGHALGMVAFGYRDVKVFFLPFIGAAVTGRKDDAPAWQRAVVLLLGPLPGVALGIALLVATKGAGSWGEAGRMLVYVNVFNMLPFEPLDGGRLLGVTIFSRSRWLDAAFAALGALAIGALALRFDAWILVIFAALALATVPRRLRLAGAAQRVKDSGLPIGPRVEALAPETLAALGREAWRLSPQAAARMPARAALVRELHARICFASPGLGATLALLFAYGGGLVISIFAVALTAHLRAPGPLPREARPPPAEVEPR